MSLRTGRRENINTMEAHAGYVNGRSEEDYKKVCCPTGSGRSGRTPPVLWSRVRHGKGARRHHRLRNDLCGHTDAPDPPFETIRRPWIPGPRGCLHTPKGRASPRPRRRMKTNDYRGPMWEVCGDLSWKGPSLGPFQSPIPRRSGFLEPPAGFEPATPCLQDRCSGQLS